MAPPSRVPQSKDCGSVNVFNEFNSERFFGEFDWVSGFRLDIFEIELLSAVGTVFECGFDDFVDEFWSDGFSEMLFVSFLCSDFSPPLFVFLRFCRFNDVGRERYGEGHGTRHGEGYGAKGSRNCRRDESQRLFPY